MKPEKVSLETSDGALRNDPTEAEISTALERIGAGSDHCILDFGDTGFIQAAGSKDSLLLQYRDRSGMYESTRSDFSAAEAKGILLEALNGGIEWKTKHSFTLTEAGSGAGSPPESSGGPAGERSLKDQILASVKKETEAGIAGLIGKGIRGLFGK